MVLDAVSNFVRGQVDAAVTTSDTTVSVADVSIFPDPATDGEFNVIVWNANNFPRPDQDGDVEILRVTARDTTADEVTVVRAQEGTAAAAHPEGSAVHLSPTAKMFGDIEGTFADFWDSGTQELTADVNNESVSTESLGRGEGNLISEGGTWSTSGGIITDLPDEISSSEFTAVAGYSHALSGETIPDGCSLYANFTTHMTVPNGETGTVRPVITRRNNSGDISADPIEELEIERSDGFGGLTGTGWVDIPVGDYATTEVIFALRMEAKVTGGTLEFAQSTHRHGLVFEWRVD